MIYDAQFDNIVCTSEGKLFVLPIAADQLCDDLADEEEELINSDLTNRKSKKFYSSPIYLSSSHTSHVTGSCSIPKST